MVIIEYLIAVNLILFTIKKKKKKKKKFNKKNKI